MNDTRLSRGRAGLIAVVAAIAVSASLVPGEARAETPPPSVVIWAEGPDSDQARTEITKSLGGDARVVDPGAWRDAFRHAGPPVALGRDLARTRTRPAALERAQRAAVAAGVGEVVLVTTSRAKGGRHFADAYLVVPDKDPETLAHVPFGLAAGGLGDQVHDRIVAANPPEPPPPATSETPPQAEPAEPSTPLSGGPEFSRDVPATNAPGRSLHEVGHELFEVSAGGGVATRNFSFTDPLTGNLRSYQLGAAPLLVAEGALYPFADLHIPVLSDIGGVGGYAQAVALNSASTESGSIGTSWQSWYAGGRLRFRTGSESWPVIGVQGTYGYDGFTFSGSDPSSTYPSVAYRYLGANADVRVPIGRFAVMARGGYLDVLSAGDVAARFPRATVGGVDFGVGASVAIAYGLEARIQGSYGRFFYAMNPRPGDAYVAGGALDESWVGEAKLAYVF
jgi:hypothetical protein